jgi:dipeptidyl aminopeptidase/acylaminoacyl peptidase
LRSVTNIDATRCIATRDLSEPRLVRGGTAVVYGVSQAGSTWLQVQPLDGGPVVRLGEATGVRTGRGMGGGAWSPVPGDEAVVYVGGDGNLWWQSLDGGAAQQLTDHGPDRSASAPAVSPDGTNVAYVVELAEVRVVDLATHRSTRVDDDSADFVIDPSWSPVGDLHWVEWDVPDMPWDRTRVARLRRATGEQDRLAPDHAVQQVRFLADGTMLHVCDTSGWLNVQVGERPLVDEPFEHAGPTWGPGQRSYAVSPDGNSVAFTRNERGFGRLCVASLHVDDVREVARGVHGQLSWQGGRLAALRTGARTPTQVVVYDMRATSNGTWERTVVAVGPEGDWTDDELVEPELVEVPTDSGIVHGRLYRAAASTGRLIVWLHGGPTDQWQVTFMPRLAFWRSRGWHVLVPDHRGSTGHGRAYQQALRGRWGDLDVTDTIDATRWAQQQGLATADRTVLFGSSSGGFTALGAVAQAPGAYAGAAVLYPVTDLVDLAERSHRFERHYTDSLVGPLPEARALASERSPAHHPEQFVNTPLLVLHGDVDPVVPVEQSQVFVERVRATGGDATLHVYAGEGHGFRQLANQLDEYRRVEEFLRRICD